MEGEGTRPNLCLQRTIRLTRGGIGKPLPIGQKCRKNIFGNVRATTAVAVGVAGVRVGKVTNTANCSWVNVDIDVDFGHERGGNVASQGHKIRQSMSQMAK